MSELRIIVDKLSGAPFHKRYSLVTLDELSASGRLALLLEVIGHLDAAIPAKLAAKPKEGLEVSGPALRHWLELMKWKSPGPAALSRGTQGGAAHHASHAEDEAALEAGVAEYVWSALAHLLARWDSLTKRAYVAKYLAPPQLPPEVSSEPAVQAVLAELRTAQAGFKATHQELEKIRGTVKRDPASMRAELAQLEEERRQLRDKIDSMKKKTADVPGFPKLLAATSDLRMVQEEEAALQERAFEQRAGLAGAEKRYSEASRRLAETRASIRQDMTGAQLCAATEAEWKESRELLQTLLPRALASRQDTLARLQRALAEPPQSAQAMAQLRSSVAAAEHRVQQLTQQVAEAQRAAGDSKLAMFRQQAAVIAKQRADKSGAVEAARLELESLTRDVESKEARMSALAGPRYMRREEFKAYAAALREKTSHYRDLKAALAALRSETVVLARTEALLKSRAENLEGFMAKLEKDRGVAGYTGVAADLEKVSAMKAAMDAAKGKTLSEISSIVAGITTQLKEKKGALQPAIQELRATRSEYSEIEAAYLSAKATYDSTSAGLANERLSLQKQASALGEDNTREENAYHSMQIDASTYRAALARAEDEAAYQAGRGRLMRDFKTWTELLQHKLMQQESLMKTLRTKQRNLRDNAAGHAAQRRQFMGLAALMQAKLDSSQQALQAAKQDAQDNVGGVPGDGGAAGDTNIMTFD